MSLLSGMCIKNDSNVLIFSNIKLYCHSGYVYLNFIHPSKNAYCNTQCNMIYNGTSNLKPFNVLKSRMPFEVCARFELAFYFTFYETEH